MAASIQYRPQERGHGMVMKENDDDLALFLEMQNSEKERKDLLFQNSNELDNQLGSKQDRSQITKIPLRLPVKMDRLDDFLNSENNKTDYDWLLTPPGTPLFPSAEVESQKTVINQTGISHSQATALKSRLAKPLAEPASRNNMMSWHPSLSTRSSSSGARNRRPSLVGSTLTASRPATPTGRPTLPVISKLARSSTPTLRATLSSTKTTARPVRSSTPTRSTVRLSTPIAKASVTSASNSISRSATPTSWSSTPSSTPSTSAPPSRSSSVTRSGQATMKNMVPSRGTSPTVRSRPRKPSEMPGLSHDAPSNLRTSIPEIPASPSRGRPGAPSTQSSSIETSSNGRTRQQSCSPSKGRAPHGNAYNNGSSVPSMRRTHSSTSDDVSPGLIGTRMVERVVNMRKLAPPKQDDHLCGHNYPIGKSLSSQDSSGFGRTLSKESLDMALRHMDIRPRRSIPGNLRPLKTNIPASSRFNVRTGSTKSPTVGVLDSPLGTSSNASSEPSVNNNSHFLDGSEVEDSDLGSDRAHSSPASQ
ncbi:uncharacterized protein LOC132313286 [Cornus florida]|uniref:uncharacterized protein LOC132313286 n=1 Tax=Cornus florida TaxID=4283 RepID=UPI00289B4E13|nr:uncharacterized protein LOC132313286 [Cornus florida]